MAANLFGGSGAPSASHAAVTPGLPPMPAWLAARDAGGCLLAAPAAASFLSLCRPAAGATPDGAILAAGQVRRAATTTRAHTSPSPRRRRPGGGDPERPPPRKVLLLPDVCRGLGVRGPPRGPCDKPSPPERSIAAAVREYAQTCLACLSVSLKRGGSRVYRLLELAESLVCRGQTVVGLWRPT